MPDEYDLPSRSISATAQAQQLLARKLSGRRIDLGQRDLAVQNEYRRLISIPSNKRALSNIAAAKIRAKELGFANIQQAQQLSGFASAQFQKSEAPIIEKTSMPIQSGQQRQVFFSGGQRYTVVPLEQLPSFEALIESSKTPLTFQELAAQQRMQNQVQQKSAATIPRSPTIVEAYERTKLVTQQEGIKEGFKTGISTFTDAVLKITERKNLREDAIKKQRGGDQTLAYRTRIATEEESQLPTGSRFSSGTAELIPDFPTDVELERDAKLGDERAFRVLLARNQEELQAKANLKFAIGESKIKAKAEELEEDVFKGNKTVEQANLKLQQYANQIQNNIMDEVNSNLESEKKKLNKIAFQGNLTKAAITSLTIAIPSGMAFGLISRGGKLAKVAEAVGALFFGKEVSKLSFDVAKGERGLKDVALFGVSNVAFLGGFAAGAKATSKLRPNIAQQKLETAIKNSDIVIKQKGFVTEQNLRKYDLPAKDVNDIKASLQGGYSLQRVEGQIKPSTIADKELINKELPYRKIEFIVVTDRLGNVIKRVAVGKTEITTKQGKVYKQDIIAESFGQIFNSNLETTTITATGKRLSITGQALKGIEKATVTKEISTGEIYNIPNSPYKIVKTQAGIKLIESREGKITLKDIQALKLKGQIEEGTEISQSQFIDVQKQVKKQIDAYQQGTEAIVLTSDESLNVGLGLSKKTGKTLKIKKVDSSVKTKKGKTLSIEDLTQNQVELNRKVKTNNKQIEKQIKKSEDMLDKGESATDLETGIRQSVEQISKSLPKQDQIKALRQAPITAAMSQSQIRQLNKNISIDALQESSMQDIINLQTPALKTQTSEKIKLKLMQIAPIDVNFDIPPVDVPTVKIPSPVSQPQEIKKIQNLQKQKKKTKVSPHYTPSLSSAIADYGIEVDPKKINQKIEELSKKAYTGLEVRPILKVKSKKKRR